MPLLGDLKTFVRYAGGLRAFLQDPLTSLDCRRIVEQQLRTREVSFLRMVERAVYANASSPYRALLQHRKIALEDVSRSLRQAGLEATLAWLYDEGIYVTLDQFKGRRPIERPGLGLPVRATDFDNPLLVHHYEASTGGSRGPGTRTLIDLDLLAHEAAYYGVFQGAFGLDDRPSAVWYPVPPAVAGMKQVLRCAKLGTPPERWFSQTRLVGGHGSVKHLAFTGYTVLAGRILGDRPLPTPDHTPLSQAARVAAWLARKAAAGRPAVLGTSPSSAVRAPRRARARARHCGHVLPAGERALHAGQGGGARDGARAGCLPLLDGGDREHRHAVRPARRPRRRASAHRQGHGAAARAFSRSRTPGVRRLYFTTLLPSCPKLMINVESDDHGVLEERDCGCPFGDIGLRQHLHTVRSDDKVSSEGMTLLASEVFALVEAPAGPVRRPATDYQFVEQEEAGLSRINVVASPRLGRIDEARLVATVCDTLGAASRAHGSMTDIWRQAGAVRVVRREPYTTSAAKILPLHILRAGDDSRGS